MILMIFIYHFQSLYFNLLLPTPSKRSNRCLRIWPKENIIFRDKMEVISSKFVLTLIHLDTTLEGYNYSEARNHGDNFFNNFLPPNALKNRTEFYRRNSHTFLMLSMLPLLKIFLLIICIFYKL